ncbi:MAG TPA: MotA/TolQ/ExbB proton channel family protein [Gammaproteobacteria bacterium]|nr:MotA/TolQ/ExbB proton channel family protein [Gammaproteobacteria bacterium]
MNIFKKTAVLALGATVLVGGPAQAQISSVNDLLQKVRADAAKTAAENAARERELKSNRDAQAAKLNAARSELNALERQAKSVQSTFDANQNKVTALEGQLKAAQGDFGEVFGLARSKAGEFKATLDSSLITAQYPTRTNVLGLVSESKALPNTDQLNAIWKSMLSEIKYQRQVATFSTPINNMGDNGEVDVTRIGPFAIFTKDDAQFLEYAAPKEEGIVALTALPRQPGGAVSKAAKAVANAGAGNLVFGPIDPTRGSLLKSFERVPDTRERVDQGGPIGKIIIGLMLFGIALGLFRLVVLFLTSTAVKAQKKKAQPSKSNPLGRVMMAYESAKDKDEEIIELKLDEAILRESPKLEMGLNFLKLGAGIAPLLGLLGTVTGMIKTFQAMMIYGTGDPQLMAGGISEALVTTMLGLIAAIPLLILHSFCASMARSVQGTLEEQSAGIVARHVESRRG